MKTPFFSLKMKISWSEWFLMVAMVLKTWDGRDTIQRPKVFFCTPLNEWLCTMERTLATLLPQRPRRPRWGMATTTAGTPGSTAWLCRLEWENHVSIQWWTEGAIKGANLGYSFIPHILPIQLGAVWSDLEFPNHLVDCKLVYCPLPCLITRGYLIPSGKLT